MIEDEQDAAEPELELGQLDATSQGELDALEAAEREMPLIADPELTSHELSARGSTHDSEPASNESAPPSEPAPIPRGWPSFFPDAAEHSRDFIERLAPSDPPLTAAESAARSDPDQSAVLRVQTEDLGEPRPATPSGGLISSILGQSTAASSDDGALAALRTLPRRAEPELLPAWNAGDPTQLAARLELLIQLAKTSTGAVRARLEVSIAELHAHQGNDAEALAAYRAAASTDPSDRLALRRLRRQQLQRSERQSAAAAFRAESQIDARERSLALCAALELDAAAGVESAQLCAAAQAAFAADPRSSVAALVYAQAALAAQRPIEAANALRGAAAALPDKASRGLLLLEAARLLELAGHPEAVSCYAEAAAAQPGALAAQLGSARLALAATDPNPLLTALSKLAELCDDPALQAEFVRLRAQRLAQDTPAAAAALLQDTPSVHGLRLLARVAEAAGDTATQARAFEAWGHLAGGGELGLARLELASLHGRAGRGDAAFAALREAQAARAPATLLEVVRDALLRAYPNSSTSSDLTSRGGEDALRAAAKLARDRSLTSAERDLLAGIAPSEAVSGVAEVLAFDVNAELGDIGRLQDILAREPARWPQTARIGALFAALDLASNEGSPAYTAQRAELLALAQGQPIVQRYLAAQARDPASVAELWLGEADSQSGEAAAFAATMAGRYYERAGSDPTEIYAEALDAVRGYPAGAFGLEIAARARGDLAALERVHRELASTTESKHERSARFVRLGLLNADNDLEGAVRWLELAAEDAPSDAILEELSLRLSMDQSPTQLAERLRAVATLEATPAFARALSLRAAAASESAGQWEEAIGIYQQLVAADAEDGFAAEALLMALRRSHRFAHLATELERHVNAAEDPRERAGLLQELALAEHARGDSERARVVLETLIETDPHQVAALRALARDAMRCGDDARLAHLTLRLCESIEDPTARSAELQFAVRLSELVGNDAVSPLLRIQTGKASLWHALALESLALRSGDRPRMYDALRALSELLPEPMERAAYALRAAEVMENAAPAMAARELAATLLATPEHPLAIEQLARLYKAAHDPLAAANTFERAGFLAGQKLRSAPLFYAAGVLFQDELSDPDRARENFSRVAQSDVLFADTFTRLRMLLAQAGRPTEHKALLETRLAVSIDPAFAMQLEIERADLAAELGDRRGAKQALSEAVRQKPSALALERLADLHTADGEYREAAEALVQLARVAETNEALADAFFRLGVLYDEALPDPKRAEIAFMRVVALSPDDVRPVERLASLFTRQSKHDEALRTLGVLVEMTSNLSQREEYMVQRAETLARMGQQKAAEQVLDEARRFSPCSMRVLWAFNALYERQGDKTALALHLQRSCHALRAAIELDPGEISNWLGLCELLRARGRGDSVAQVTSMAHALGLTHAALVAQPVQGLGRDGLREAVQRKLFQRGPLDPLRTLLHDHGAAIGRFLPFEGPAHPASLDHANMVVQAVTQLFGLSDLRLVGSNQPICLPLRDEPLTLGVGRALFLQASDAERFFLLARAIAVAKLGYTLLVRSVPEQVMLVIHALWKVVDPAHSGAVLDAQEQARVTHELSASILAPARPKLKGVLEDLMHHEDVNPRRLAASALDYGARVALMVTGNASAALNALLRLRGKPPQEFGLEQRLDLCRTDPAVRALLSFAISEIYLDARRELTHPGAQDAL